MSAILVVECFKQPSEKFKKMKAVYDACLEADIAVPEKVADYFYDRVCDDIGEEIPIPTTEWKADMKEGYEIRVEDIPCDAEVIRVYMSY